MPLWGIIIMSMRQAAKGLLSITGSMIGAGLAIAAIQQHAQ
jgi:hypothetical protein